MEETERREGILTLNPRTSSRGGSSSELSDAGVGMDSEKQCEVGMTNLSSHAPTSGFVAASESCMPMPTIIRRAVNSSSNTTTPAQTSTLCQLTGPSTQRPTETHVEKHFVRRTLCEGVLPGRTYMKSR